MEQLESFLDLSVLLTGFSRIELLGTGMANDYLCTLEAALPADVYEQLLQTWDTHSAHQTSETEAEQLLNDPKFGPVAQSIILLWYCGSWNALPETWRTTYGASPHDINRVVSANAYQAGLQWLAAGAHAPGSAQQGFAAWAQPPEGRNL